MAPPTLAVFGGSFDPPHLGHVLAPRWILARGLADRVLVVPTWRHALGKVSAPYLHRLAWTRMAMRGQDPQVTVSDLESRLAAAGGGGTSLELLSAVAEREDPHVRVRLVVGSDIVASGETARWHRWEELSRRFDPIVVPRAGFPLEGAPAAVLPQVASTWVRERVAAGAWDEVRPWLPEAVVRWHGIRRRRAGREVWLVGAGHVATHAGPWIAERGYDVVVIGARELGRGQWPPLRVPPAAVWVTARDPALPDVARAVVRLFDALDVPAAVPVFHAAGAIPAGSERGLAPLAARGHAVGTLHPICSLRGERDDSPHLWRATFGVEAEGAARAFAEELLDGQPSVDLTGMDRAARLAYHGACALVANHLSVLLQASAGVMAASGAVRTPEPDGPATGGEPSPRPRDEAAAAGAVPVDALLTLMASALDNLRVLGLHRGRTGPAARGDLDTVRAHLQALPPGAAELYRVLASRLLPPD